MASLLPILEKMRRYLHALAEQYRNEKEAAKSSQSASVYKEPIAPTIRAELHVPESVIERITSSSDEEEHREHKKIFIEAMTFVVVLIYAIFAGMMWYEMNTQNINQSAAFMGAAATADRSLKQSETSLQIDERAWIGADLKMDKWGPLAPYYFTYTFKFKNYGRSPALNVWTIDHAWAYGLKFPDSPYYLKKMPNPFEVHSIAPLFPGEEHQMPGTSHISQATVDEIGKAHLWWYTYGIITYDDIFGKHHTTHFCYRHGVNPPDNYPILCNTYNDAD